MVESLIGNKITNGEQLDGLAKQLFGKRYIGLFDWKDKLPVLKNGECIIINKKSNEHWIGTIKLNDKLYTYDSFNRPDYIGGNLSGDNDLIPDQNYNQENCGSRVLAWLTTILSF